MNKFIFKLKKKVYIYIYIFDEINIWYFIKYIYIKKYHKWVIVYLKLTDACQTKANNKKKTGIIGNTFTIASKGA